jgi:hypothetical protein
LIFIVETGLYTLPTCGHTGSSILIDASTTFVGSTVTVVVDPITDLIIYPRGDACSKHIGCTCLSAESPALATQDFTGLAVSIKTDDVGGTSWVI